MIEISHHAHFQSRVNVFWELSVDKFPRRLTSHKLIDIRHLIQPEKGTKIVKMTYFFTILTFINHFHENSYREVNFWVVQFYNLLWLRYRFLFNPMPILSFHFLSIFLLAFSVVVRFFGLWWFGLILESQSWLLRTFKSQIRATFKLVYKFSAKSNKSQYNHPWTNHIMSFTRSAISL